jgi:hypothetical protein
MCGPKSLIVQPPKFHVPSYSSIFRASSLSKPQCSQLEVYDETVGECRPLLAKDNLNFGEILKRYAVVLEYKERLGNCGISSLTESESVQLITRRKDVFQKLLEINLMERDSKILGMKIQPLANFSFRVMFELLENAEENDLVASNIGVELKIQNLSFHSNMRNFTAGNRGLCRYSLTGSMVHEMLCAENETFSFDEVLIYENKSALIKKTGQFYKTHEYLLFKRVKKLAVCKDYWPGHCSYYIEVKEESDWSVYENGSVYTDVMKASWLHYGQYTIVDGVLRFCSGSQNASVVVSILSYATNACLSVSIVGLTLLLIVYSIFSPLRNLPGKNLMLFSAILAFSQLIWLLQRYVSSISPTFCVATCFALEYSLIACFSSSTSIAFHSFLTFLNISKGKLTPSSGRFWHYVLYSLGFPLLIVLTCKILYHYDIISIVHLQYICWFKDDKSIFIAVYVPLFTTLLLNFVLFFKTMMFIRNCTKEHQKLAQKPGAPTKMQIAIYLRMSTVMGATWLFGAFIVIFPGIVVFEYLFVFINGLQGVYIAFAFLFTDNVKKLFIRGKNRGTSTSRTNNSRSMYTTTASIK